MGALIFILTRPREKMTFKFLTSYKHSSQIVGPDSTDPCIIPWPTAVHIRKPFLLNKLVQAWGYGNMTSVVNMLIMSVVTSISPVKSASTSW